MPGEEQAITSVVSDLYEGTLDDAAGKRGWTGLARPGW